MVNRPVWRTSIIELKCLAADTVRPGLNHEYIAWSGHMSKGGTSDSPALENPCLLALRSQMGVWLTPCSVRFSSPRCSSPTC